jgi:hypothetical protein
VWQVRFAGEDVRLLEWQVADACVRRVGDSMEKLRPASRLHFLFKIVGEGKQLARGETIRGFRLASLEG